MNNVAAMPNDKYLRMLATAFRESERCGEREDRPEGVRYLRVSDTLAIEMANRLDEIASMYELMP